jgi:biopolymer transport protein ExbB
MDFLTKLGLAFEHGGFWMWPILGFQIASIAIIIERSIALFGKRKTDQMALVASYEENVRRGELEVVMHKAEIVKNSSPVARAIAAGATAARNFGGKEEIQGKMDEVLLHENALLDKRVPFLAMLGNVATLTGLLGTITGMIKSFAAVANANPAEKASLLAAGIAEAMNATAFGLIVAIPALVAFAVLQNRSNELAEDMNQAALKAFNWLSFSYDPIATKAQTGHTAKASTRPSPEANA